MIATIISTVIIYTLVTVIKDTHAVKQRERWQRV